MNYTNNRKFLANIYNVILLSTLLFVGCATKEPASKGQTPSKYPESTQSNISSDISGYPQNWPKDLVYPVEFVVENAGVKVLPDGGNVGFGAVLIYQGTLTTAIESMTSFLLTKEWKVQEQMEMSTSKTMVIFYDSNTGNEGIYSFSNDEHLPEKIQVLVLIINKYTNQ